MLLPGMAGSPSGPRDQPGPWMGPPEAGQLLLWAPLLPVPHPDLACLALLCPTPQNRGGGRRRGTPRVPGCSQHHRARRDAPTLSVGCFRGGPYQELLTPWPGWPAPPRPGPYSLPQVPPQGDRCLWTKAFLQITPSGLHLCDLRRANNTCQDRPDYSGVPHQGAGRAPWVAMAARSWLCQVRGTGLGQPSGLERVRTLQAGCRSGMSPRAVHPPEITNSPRGVTPECRGIIHGNKHLKQIVVSLSVYQTMPISAW